MQSILVFCDILKIADFWWKNADVLKTQGVCHVILERYFREGDLCASPLPPPYVSSPEKTLPE